MAIPQETSGGTPLVPPSWYSSLARLARLARKELTEILRDRRTIATLVLMPLLLYPLITLAFRMASPNVAEPDVRLGYDDREESQVKDLFDWIEKTRGIPELQKKWSFTPLPGIILEQLVRQKNLELGLRLNSAGNFFHKLTQKSPVRVELIYNPESASSLETLEKFQRLLAAANIKFLTTQLEQHNVHQPVPVQVVPQPMKAEEKGWSLAVFVPLVLIFMTITGAVYPAIDLTAGERERGTLEILIAAPIPRVSLLFAKYLAVAAVAVLTGLVNFTGMTIALLVSGQMQRVFDPRGPSVLILFEGFGLVVLFAAFFSAVLLVVTSFARSFKEAQAYLVPLMLVSLCPAFWA